MSPLDQKAQFEGQDNTISKGWLGQRLLGKATWFYQRIGSGVIGWENLDREEVKE